jgi:hypothetical protein
LRMRSSWCSRRSAKNRRQQAHPRTTVVCVPRLVVGFLQGLSNLFNILS